MSRDHARYLLLLAFVTGGLSLAMLVVLTRSRSHVRGLTDLEPPRQQSVATDAPRMPHATQPALEPTYAAMLAERRSPEVPQLPFPDNPDPSQCGIPIRWGADDKAWLSGIYDGDIVQPVVLLYDSHLRLNVSARAAHGSEVQVMLYQQNPVTDYYLVKIVGAEPPNQGWVPGPFLSFEPVSPL